jgi:hypothetical protein
MIYNDNHVNYDIRHYLIYRLYILIYLLDEISTVFCYRDGIDGARYSLRVGPEWCQMVYYP